MYNCGKIAIIVFLCHILSSLTFHLRVEGVSETVAYDIEGKYGD